MLANGRYIFVTVLGAAFFLDKWVFKESMADYIKSGSCS